ncbi:hypothetical protein TREES_T100010460 [Tupaia chinensis]|uniref:Uncharacterized protein n=1 Tax=Tupaia chinensis TaxID=246437 RepID=L9LAR4_TUPCH|nr:hypothetical protein TREES_T100010460 [Tupaia chinensis]
MTRTHQFAQSKQKWVLDSDALFMQQPGLAASAGLSLTGVKSPLEYQRWTEFESKTTGNFYIQHLGKSPFSEWEEAVRINLDLEFPARPGTMTHPGKVPICSTGRCLSRMVGGQ